MEIMYMSNFLGNKEAFERKMLAKIQGWLVCKLLSLIDNMDGHLLYSCWLEDGGKEWSCVL